MGHEGGRPERGTSRIGALFRETTAAMLARVAATVDERLTVPEAIGARLLPKMDKKRKERLSRRRRKRTPQAE
jgi:hypothetical protein